MELHYTILGRPATKKNSMRIAYHGNRPILLQSEQYNRYEKDALKQLVRHKPKEPITEPVEVSCVYYMPTRRRVDLLNLLAASHDILVKAGILYDDNSSIIFSVDGSRVLYDKENPRVEITVKTERKPLTRGKEVEA